MNGIEEINHNVNNFKQLNNYPGLSNDLSSYFLANDKVWVFGQNYKDQPTYNSGHFVTFTGSNVKFFDLKTNKWDSENYRPVNLITNEENLEELIFVFSARIFMFLYTAFGPLNNATLYYFNEKTFTWEKNSHSKLLLNSKNENEVEKRSFKLVQSEDGNFDGIYLIDNNYKIYFLKIDEKTSNFIEMEQPNKFPYYFSNSLPAVSAYFVNKIYLQISRYGCGYIYDPLNLYIYDLIEKTWSNATIKNENENGPPISYFGAKTTVVNFPLPNSWTHLTSLKRQGMTGSKFDGDIWTLSIDEIDKLEWKKLSEIPADDIDTSNESNVLFNKKLKQVLFFVKNLGVFSLQL